MKQVLTFALLFMTLAGFARPLDKTIEDLLGGLKERTDELIESTPTLTSSASKLLLEELFDLASQIHEHSAVTINDQYDAVELERRASYAVAKSHITLLMMFRSVVERAIKLYPVGHVNAATAELQWIQLRYPDSKSDPEAFIEQIKQFASTYPENPSAPYVVSMFARNLFFTNREKEAFEVLNGGLKIYPGNKSIKYSKSMYEMTGTQAKLKTQTITEAPFCVAEVRDKVVLLEFWSTWCKPCRTLTPKLKELYKKYKVYGFEIVGFSTDFHKSDLEDYIQAHNLPWLNLFEPDLAERIRIERNHYIWSVPTLFILDRNGNFHTAGLGGDFELIESRIRLALGLSAK